jgi:glycosyltransferase involved in cell wall biosynthesis
VRLTYVLPGGGVSGGIRVTVQSANMMLARGHEVRILHQARPATLRAFAGSLYRRWVLRGRSDWLPLFRGRCESFRDIRDCRFAEDEVVIGVGTWGSAEVGRIARGTCRPVQYLHGSWRWEPGLFESVCRSPLPKIVVGSHLVEEVISSGGAAPLAVVPNGIDTREYYPCAAEDARDGVGLIFHRAAPKAPEVCLAFLERMRDLRPEVPQYVFGAVRRPPEIPRKAYWFLPPVRRARYLYSRSLVWVLASRSEGFPAPILEAMACGAAVVSTDCGGPRDMITDRQNGFLVPVGDVPALAERACRLLDDAELRRRFVERGYETVRRFSWDAATDKLESALRQLLAEDGRTAATAESFSSVSG